MPRIATMARSAQPGVLIVDRTVHGPFENYQTPEQKIPGTPLQYPWESCITLGNNWGYVPGDKFKSATQVIHSLIEIVAKGGSLLLGVGPKPDGTLPQEAVQRLEEIGKWMNKNGEAIYGTRAVKNFQDGSTYFTQNLNNGKKFALVCLKENTALPAFIEWQGNLPAKGTIIKLLETGETAKWVLEGNQVKVYIPASVNKTKLNYPALAFSFKGVKDPE